MAKYLTREIVFGRRTLETDASTMDYDDIAGRNWTPLASISGSVEEKSDSLATFRGSLLIVLRLLLLLFVNTMCYIITLIGALLREPGSETDAGLRFFRFSVFLWRCPILSEAGFSDLIVIEHTDHSSFWKTTRGRYIYFFIINISVILW